MGQYIDKAAVMAEIEKLRKNAWESFQKGNSTEEQYYIRYGMIQDILSFINTLEVKDEVVSTDPTSPNSLEISRSGNSHIGENGDLEKAAAGYAREQLANPDYPTYNDEYEIECAFETGAKWQKEQLMKDAMDGVVFTKLDDGSIMVRTHYFKSNKIDYLDEVKLIIIKEK